MEKKELFNKFELLKKTYVEKSNELSLLQDDSNKRQNQILRLQSEQETLLLQKEILLMASDKGREAGRELFQAVATEAVRTILGDEYSVVLNSSVKNGVPWCNVMLQAKYGDVMIETDPVEEDSGGRSDCIALAFFIVLRMLCQKTNTAPQFLDEVLKSLSENYGKDAAGFLKQLIEASGTQTFIITHEKNYLPNVADKSYSLQQVDGLTQSAAL